MTSSRSDLLPRLSRLVRRVTKPHGLGVLRRTTPLSTHWGLDRGTPIDRYYIERFLRANAGDIHGRCLEVRDSGYTDRYGIGVTGRDVLDIDPGNPLVTVNVDLAEADPAPSDTFDCFILTQTLQYVSDPFAAIRHVHRMLAPRGVLLLTLPGLSRVGARERNVDRWRFTDVGCRTILEPVFGSANVEVRSHGNVLAAVAFLEGMATEELRREELDVLDPAYPVIVTARAVKDPSDQRIPPGNAP